MNVPKLMESKRGSRITGVRRVRHVFEGSVDDEHGPLELTFDDLSVLRLDAGADGERLRVDTSEWVDPFLEPLSDENRQFVLTSGKWSAFDASEEMPYAATIGQRIWEVRLVTLTNRKIVGVVFTLDSAEISAMTGPDDLRVHIH
jgi:hypothetical protein